VVSAAVPVNQFHPLPSEPLKCFDLRRIDDVLNDASDHDGRLAQDGSCRCFNSGVHIGGVALMLDTWTQTRSLRSVRS
jgi:hypothetical protein